MALVTVVKLLVVGWCIGVASGLLGIGGGVMLVPALILMLGFAQQRAVGTSLAMLLPPIGIFAVLRYRRAGQVDWGVAMIMAASFAAGAYGGAWLAARGLVRSTEAVAISETFVRRWRAEPPRDRRHERPRVTCAAWGGGP